MVIMWISRMGWRCERSFDISDLNQHANALSEIADLISQRLTFTVTFLH